ncbi:hypothetical protein CMV_028859 [Castanea mollissima]|uniref:Uncharacterized protein n=1 Tax=Castanea mollissima TaxID=60419 RepID=A0A8J4VDZ0_9ROSI|nr:hypothetical protein CMV_028859 [Castanea mollissima]
MKDCFPIRKKGSLKNPVCSCGGAHLSCVQLMKLLNRFFPVSTRQDALFGGNNNQQLAVDLEQQCYKPLKP